MHARFRDLVLIFAALFATAAALTAIDGAFRNPADEQLEAEDQALDKQIESTIKQIQALHTLRNFGSLRMAPQQAQVKLVGNGKCLEVVSHSQNHEMPLVKSLAVDYKVQNIQVCFDKDRLSKIESTFTTVSQIKKEKSSNNLVHDNPLSLKPNEIIISGTFNEIRQANLRVGDLQNSYRRPLRLAFKKDYYLPHLQQTAYILQRTYDLHRHEEVRARTRTVNQYLNYTEH